MSEQKILERIAKLMNVTTERGATEDEAANAASMVQNLLEQYGLSVAEVERRTGETGKRTDTKITGSMYRFHQEMWSEIAHMNFCLMMTGKTYIPEAKRIRNVQFKKYYRLIGREVNVQTTVNLADYLLRAIERLTKEAYEGAGERSTGRWAMSFREGCALRLRSRLQTRRRERERASEDVAKTSGTPGTSLTIVNLDEMEHDANQDALYNRPAGTSLRMRLEKERLFEEAVKAHRQWGADHPEEAEKERRKNEERASKGKDWYDRRYGHADHTALMKGYEKADEIGLDQQVSEDQARRIR